MTDTDLTWLEAERPRVPLDPAATAAARAALDRHIEHSRRPAFLRRRPVRVAAFAAAITTAAVAAIAIGLGGGDRPLAVHDAAAAPLVRLSNHVRDNAPPPGDATLIVRTQHYPDGTSYTGDDLYTDDGRYFFSETRTGLAAAVAGHEEVGDGWTKRLLAAATAANDLPLDEARDRMAIAALDPGAKPATPDHADAVAAAKATKRKLGLTTDVPPADAETLKNGNIWTNSMDALIAGAGRPAVRAGVLRLLASIPEVTVTETTVDGRQVFDLRARLFVPPRYQERLLVDAETGVPVRFIGGNVGQAPSVVVTYGVSRVTAADL